MRDPIMDPEGSAAVPPPIPASDTAAFATSSPETEAPADELDALAEPPDGIAPPVDDLGSALVVPEPAAHAVPPTGGVWTDEQVEAVRARVREVTANAADKAAGAVMATVNMVAAAIRSRTSSDRQRDRGQG